MRGGGGGNGIGGYYSSNQLYINMKNIKKSLKMRETRQATD